MSRLVTIFGGSGFVGRYIARRMAKQGWRVRVAVRRPNEALFVKPYGAVGQVEPVLCNIRDDESVRRALQGADAVVNCVGILSESGKNSFASVQAEGAARVARLARAAGVARLVHISAMGANPDGPSDYARTKAAGEAAVIAAFPGAVVLRPSVIFGPEDGFFNRFASMARFGYVLPVVGAETKFQPVYVDDVAAAAEKAVLAEVGAGIYELAGPDVMSFREMMATMLKVIHRRRMVVNIPFALARIPAALLDLAQTCTGGLFSNGTLTRDQVKSLTVDNVMAPGAAGFAAFGIAPTPIGSVLPSYLWRFRPSGQYDAIKDSAKNLHV